MLQFRDFKEGDETQLISLVMELKKFYPSIEEWLTKEKGELYKIKNLGAKSITNIEDILRKKGIALTV